MKKCSRCGGCCKEEVCLIGEEAFGQDVKPPCPALDFDKKGKAICMVVNVKKN